MSQLFAGQKLIVIGGTSGMGKAVARIVLENGGSAILIGRREEKLQA
ncbi:MAG: sugar dehydrogenase, partial [Cyanobacteria bacterium J06659_2]